MRWRCVSLPFEKNVWFDKRSEGHYSCAFQRGSAHQQLGILVPTQRPSGALRAKSLLSLWLVHNLPLMQRCEGGPDVQMFRQKCGKPVFERSLNAGEEGGWWENWRCPDFPGTHTSPNWQPHAKEKTQFSPVDPPWVHEPPLKSDPKPRSRWPT